MTTAPGLYTVPIGTTAPIGSLKKGVAKLQYKMTTPTMQKAADFVFNKVRGQWDSAVIPAALSVLKQQGITNIRLPKGNFWVDNNGNLKEAGANNAIYKARGYTYCQRKGYDPKTQIAWIWVVVG